MDKMNLQIIIMLYVAMSVAVSYNIKQKLNSKTEKWRKKINGILNKNKNGVELSLDINEFEYPGTNDTLRKVNREQWLEYYECLKQKYARSGAEKTIYPEAVMALEGTSVELECDICISPAEKHVIELVEWYFNSSSNNSVTNQLVELDEHTLMSPESKTLMMYNIQVYQAGQYWCELGNTLATPYFVHVDNSSEETQTVWPDEAPKGDHASSPTIISRYNLKAYSSWTEWTECSVCNKVGKRIRYGYCTISLLDNSTHKHVTDERVSKSKFELVNSKCNKRETNEDTTEEEEDPKKISDLVATILPVFKNKIPCRSKQSPKLIQNIKEIKNRKTEIMVGFCKVKCKENIIFEVRDKAGNILESANNSAGIYSMLQDPPDAQPTVTRVTFYKKHGKKTTLKCPGNMNTDAPVVWQIGNKVVNPKLIAEQSRDRIYVNMKNQLVIIELLFIDANIYSCWQNEELAGTIRLEVTDEIEGIKFDHHVFMFGAIIIITVLLYVFWKAFKGRKRITKH